MYAHTIVTKMCRNFAMKCVRSQKGSHFVAGCTMPIAALDTC